MSDHASPSPHVLAADSPAVDELDCTRPIATSSHGRRARVVPFSEIRMADVASVGGKNASLGEMFSQLAGTGVRVPRGFATTATAYREFLAHDRLTERIANALVGLDVSDVAELARVGARIRSWILDQPFPAEVENEIRNAFTDVVGSLAQPDQASWAVRSSATAEDLADASFAGQQESYLHILGIDNLLDTVRKVFASLYNDRAIAYRADRGYDAMDIALSAGVHCMVRSDLASSGVMFTIDTESGFDEAILITSAYGLGEAVVQGAVNPDEFTVYKPALRAGRPAILRRRVGDKAVAMRFTHEGSAGASTELHSVADEARQRLSLTDVDVERLAQDALIIEEHYGRAMDIEWAKDGIDGDLYIIQARPETVVSQNTSATLRRYALHGPADELIRGRAVGQKIGQGPARILTDPSQMSLFEEGDVLVADLTDPDWEPIMKKASAIVTNRGGRTCHAAIIARELGIPAVVGTGAATTALQNGAFVTVSCADGSAGVVYSGLLDVTVEETEIDRLPEIPVQLMLNVAVPDQAFSFAHLPCAGVGLARLEFIVSDRVGIHPRALLEPDRLPEAIRSTVRERTAAYSSPRAFFVQRVAEGVSTIAAAFAPRPVIVRMSDFKTNEYAHLLGGQAFEPTEENPMLGWRGASRYVSADFRACFEMECEAFAYVRNRMGLDNLQVMIPFVRTVQEARAVLDLMAQNGLRRGEQGLKIVMMCEIPSNALLADTFLDLFDGFSIGSNDMTQLVLGLDRDSQLVSDTFDERDPAVLAMLGMAIDACARRGKYIGICGQGPSDHPDFAQWLVERGIQSMSLNPDAIVSTWMALAGHLTPTSVNG